MTGLTQPAKKSNAGKTECKIDRGACKVFHMHMHVNVKLKLFEEIKGS